MPVACMIACQFLVFKFNLTLLNDRNLHVSRYISNAVEFCTSIHVFAYK